MTQPTGDMVAMTHESAGFCFCGTVHGPLSLDILSAEDRGRYDRDLAEWQAMVAQFEGQRFSWRDEQSFKRAWLVRHVRAAEQPATPTPSTIAELRALYEPSAADHLPEFLTAENFEEWGPWVVERTARTRALLAALMSPVSEQPTPLDPEPQT